MYIQRYYDVEDYLRLSYLNWRVIAYEGDTRKLSAARSKGEVDTDRITIRSGAERAFNVRTTTRRMSSGCFRFPLRGCSTARCVPPRYRLFFPPVPLAVQTASFYSPPRRFSTRSRQGDGVIVPLPCLFSTMSPLSPNLVSRTPRFTVTLCLWQHARTRARAKKLSADCKWDERTNK